MNNWEYSKTENLLLNNLLSFSFHFFSLAALREMFRAKSGNYPEFSSGKVSRSIGLPQIDKENIAPEVESRNIEDQKREDGKEKNLSRASSLIRLNDASDEFFDVPEPSSDDGQSDHDWPSDPKSEYHYRVLILMQNEQPILDVGYTTGYG